MKPSKYSALDSLEDFQETKERNFNEEKAPPQTEAISLIEAMEQFKYASRVEGKAKKTLEQYNYVFKKFLDYLQEDPEIKTITPQQIRGFIQKLRDEELAITTVSIHYRVLRTFFNWLLGETLLEESPLSNIKQPKTPNKFPRILNLEQTKQLINAAEERKHAWAGNRNYCIVKCFIDMGLRLNELTAAKCSDLDFQERTLKVYGKGAKDRMVFFGLETYKSLRKWISTREDKGEPLEDTIFISQNGDRLKHRYVQRIITKIQERAELQDTKVSPHVLRHTAATLAVRNGMEPFALKRFFGWEKIETAMRYVHMNNKAVKQSFRKSSPIDNLQRSEGS